MLLFLESRKVVLIKQELNKHLLTESKKILFYSQVQTDVSPKTICLLIDFSITFSFRWKAGRSSISWFTLHTWQGQAKPTPENLNSAWVTYSSDKDSAIQAITAAPRFTWAGSWHGEEQGTALLPGWRLDSYCGQQDPKWTGPRLRSSALLFGSSRFLHCSLLASGTDLLQSLTDSLCFPEGSSSHYDSTRPGSLPQAPGTHKPREWHCCIQSIYLCLSLYNH